LVGVAGEDLKEPAFDFLTQLEFWCGGLKRGIVEHHFIFEDGRRLEDLVLAQRRKSEHLETQGPG
jgi:hypothetical protein